MLELLDSALLGGDEYGGEELVGGRPVVRVRGEHVADRVEELGAVEGSHVLGVLEGAGAERLPLFAIFLEVLKRDQLVGGDAEAEDVRLLQVWQVLQHLLAEELARQVPAVALRDSIGLGDLGEEPSHAQVG